MSIKEIKAAEFYLLQQSLIMESNYLIQIITFQNPTQFFKGVQCNVLILFQRIQGFIIDTAF